MEKATQGLAEAVRSEVGRASLKAFFEKLDKDGNGKVSKKEWGSKVGKEMTLMAKYFGGSTPAEIRKAFGQIFSN